MPLHELLVLTGKLRMESNFSSQELIFGGRAALKDLKAFWTAQASTFCTRRSQVGLKLFELHDPT
ncbi:hypothetical protein SNL152K_5986 [Streptomyces sp. NL15-2K]|nr:hypothetical protein SNL152K_5986 [Streptomyces sp. NL15-2K]